MGTPVHYEQIVSSEETSGWTLQREGFYDEVNAAAELVPPGCEGLLAGGVLRRRTHPTLNPRTESARPRTSV